MSVQPLVEPFHSAYRGFSDWWDRELKKQRNRERASGTLNHYTDAKGLAGILKNDELWLTSIFHLNDPSELTHGINLAIDALRTQTEGAHPAIQKTGLDVQKMLENRMASLFTFFVASLSRDEDELGQWRAYGDDGRGFAVGIASNLLRGSTSPSDVGLAYDRPTLARVTYGEDRTRRKQKDVVQKAVEAIEPCLADARFDEFRAPFLENVAVTLTMAIVWNSITTKHAAYKHEEETRLILVKEANAGSTGIESRTRGASLIPFARFKFKAPLRASGNIKRIVVGPAAAPEAEDAVAHLLRSVGIDPDDLIVPSGIPYRSRL